MFLHYTAPKSLNMKQCIVFSFAAIKKTFSIGELQAADIINAFLYSLTDVPVQHCNTNKV